MHVVAEAVPDGRAFDAQLACSRAATYRQAVRVQFPFAEPARVRRVHFRLGEFELVCANPADSLVAARGLEPRAHVVAERARDDERVARDDVSLLPALQRSAGAAFVLAVEVRARVSRTTHARRAKLLRVACERAVAAPVRGVAARVLRVRWNGRAEECERE